MKIVDNATRLASRGDPQLTELARAIETLAPRIRARLLHEAGADGGDASQAAMRVMQHLQHLVPAITASNDAALEGLLDELSRSTGRRSEVSDLSAFERDAVRQNAFFGLADAKPGGALEVALRAAMGRGDAGAELAADLEALGVVGGVTTLAKNFGAGLQTIFKATQKVANAGRGGDKTEVPEVSGLGWSAHEALQQRRATRETIYGRAPEGGTHVMVTMPVAADKSFMDEQIAAGATVARINGAHGDETIWSGLVGAVGGRVPILMDLPGPKNRTSMTAPLDGAALRVRVRRDHRGIRSDVGAPVRLSTTIGVAQPAGDHGSAVIPVLPRLNKDGVAKRWRKVARELEDGGRAKLRYIDNDGRKRPLRAYGLGEGEIEVVATKTSWFATGRPIQAKLGGDWVTVATVGELPLDVPKISLTDGETLVLKADPNYLGHSAYTDDDGHEVLATMGSRFPEAFASVEKGHRIRFDDGAIEGTVQQIVPGPDGTSQELHITVGPPGFNPDHTEPRTRRMKANKGIALPDSHVRSPALTDHDRAILPFVADHADMIAFSFVQTAEDVRDLVEALREIGAKKGLEGQALADWLATKTIVPKIETKLAVDNFVEILLAVRASGMQVSPMIARGDLLAEGGPENLARIQRRLAVICNVLRLPFIYATGVGEGIAKKGVTTRADESDLDMGMHALGADVIMVNQGPYIAQLVRGIQERARL